MFASLTRMDTMSVISRPPFPQERIIIRLGCPRRAILFKNVLKVISTNKIVPLMGAPSLYTIAHFLRNQKIH